MAVQRSQSQPGQFRAGVAAAQAGRGRTGMFYSAHSQQHADALSRMDDHERRLASLEALDPTTFDAETGMMKPPGPQNYMHTAEED
jgi:hypothetical protein